MLRQLSYAIKNQRGASKDPLGFCVLGCVGFLPELVLYGIKESCPLDCPRPRVENSARGLNNLNLGLVWDQDMPFPAHGGKTILSYFGIVSGGGAAMLGYNLSLDIQSQSLINFQIFSNSGERELIILYYDISMMT